MALQKTEQAQWYEDTIEPHETSLRLWLLGRFPDIGPVDDILQETFLRAIKARDREPLRSPKAFLFTTARNLAIDHLRRAKVSGSESLTEYDLSNVIDNGKPIPEQVSLEQEFEILEKAIDSLPSKCRTIFRMKKVQGMSQSEIARELGVSVHTVTTQLRIGLHKCAFFFEQYRKEGKKNA